MALVNDGSARRGGGEKWDRAKIGDSGAESLPGVDSEGDAELVDDSGLDILFNAMLSSFLPRPSIIRAKSILALKCLSLVLYNL